jgi:hypothetical protein
MNAPDLGRPRIEARAMSNTPGSHAAAWSRRQFIGSLAATAAAVSPGSVRVRGANDRVGVGFIGLDNRVTNTARLCGFRVEF